MKKKLIVAFLLLSILTLSFVPNVAFAQEGNPCFASDTKSTATDPANLGTLLPKKVGEADCKKCMERILNNQDPPKYYKDNEKERNNILACGIITGRIAFWMIPFYIVRIIEFLIAISGLVAILFIVIGGYQYIISGVSQNKDAGKNTIRNAIIGLVVVLIAWVVVNVIQIFLTI